MHHAMSSLLEALVGPNRWPPYFDARQLQPTAITGKGDVFYVSADALQHRNPAGASRDVYLARINVSPTELATVHNFAPTPGMPAEVSIQTKERIFLSYIVKPVADSMSRAFAGQ